MRLPSIRLGRSIVLAMLAVVVSYSGSLWYSQWKMRFVSGQAGRIIDVATQGIQRLGDARTELRRLGMYASEYAVRSDGAVIVTEEEIRATRDRLDEELSAFTALPALEGEVRLSSEISRRLRTLDAALEELLGSGPGSPSSFEVLHGKFHPRLEEADLAINELRTFNTQKARQEARAILAAGERSAAIAAVLGSLSLAVALMATVMVIRAVRDRARLVEQHGQMLAARATEMEAFAGRVAHDLKTPLGAVALRILATERRGEIPAWLQDDLDKVSGQVRRLDHIIDGLLEFARAGANPPPGARARLQDVLDEVVGEIAPSAAAVDAELRVEPFARMRLACTPGALTSVLCNLLENAVKYISGGRHHPRRIAVRVKDLGQVARVEVEDNGPGLPRGSERLVFEPFQRLSDTRTPGIGLGLATVKRIVEAYRGRIGVHSEPGEGSTFWFELPKAPPEDVPRRDSPDSPASSAHPATPAPPPAPG